MGDSQPAGTGGQQSAVGQQPPQPAGQDHLHMWLGFVLVLAGLVVILILALVLINSTNYKASTDVTAILGAVTGVIASVVTAFFGISTAGSGQAKAQQGQAQAEANHAKAATNAMALATFVDPARAEEVRGLLQSLSR
jgi:hypothetical protein